MITTWEVSLKGKQFRWEYTEDGEPADCWSQVGTDLIPPKQALQQLNRMLSDLLMKNVTAETATQERQQLFKVFRSLNISDERCSELLSIPAPIRCRDCRKMSSDHYGIRCKDCHERFHASRRVRNLTKPYETGGMSQ